MICPSCQSNQISQINDCQYICNNCMKNFSESENLVSKKNIDETEKASYLEKCVDLMIKSGQQDVRKYIDKIRAQNPNISNKDLANKIVGRKAFKNGLVGAVTGLGGILTLPVAVPADIYASWQIQIFMILAVAHIYEHDFETMDIKTDVFLVMAGDSAKECLKRVGIEVGKEVTKKAVNTYITREVMKKIWKVIPQKIVTKAGEKSMTSFIKMAPLVGAPIGFTFDWTAAQIVGKTAIKYYSGGG